jgi:3-hydroxyisobutyrate dehydrogenase-like beta-hydroxyacid dehydrogenase
VKSYAPVGIVGIGLVGSALANNLLEHDYRVIGFDINSERMELLESIGGQVADSISAVGDQCTRVILSLHTSDIVCDVVEGKGGLLSSQPILTTIVDTTTGDPNATMALAERLSTRGCTYLDATISGSSAQIQNKKGVFLVGGSEGGFAEAQDIFESCAETYFHVGPPGDGSKTKLASNLILGLNRAALAEGIVFAERLGLDLQRFMDVVKHTPAYSAAMETKAVKMINCEFSPQSRISQHRKDLDIILAYASRYNQRLPLTQVHHTLLTEAEQAGFAGADTSAVIEAIRAARDFTD